MLKDCNKIRKTFHDFFLEISKFLVTTGFNDNLELDSTEMINLKDSCTKTLPNYPEKLYLATGEFINGIVLICGGYGGHHSSETYEVNIVMD